MHLKKNGCCVGINSTSSGKSPSKAKFGNSEKASELAILTVFDRMMQKEETFLLTEKLNNSFFYCFFRLCAKIDHANCTSWLTNQIIN